MTFTPPNLAEMVAKYQAFLAPEDPRFGDGISGWNITSEYDPNPLDESDGSPIWGCMCSPSVLASEGRRVKLQPEDIAAKRAHIVVRTPRNRAELIEMERTVLHELGHVLHAKLNLPRDAEEEIMHSLDHFFLKLSPEEGQILARSFQNHMARAYRATAKEGDMPDPIEDPKKPDKEAPKMQEGARDAAAINADIANADPNDSALLAKLAMELRQALIAKAVEPIAGNGPASEPSMLPAPTMGMKPEDAYMRQAAADRKEAIEAIIDANPHLDDKQKAMARKMPSVKDARELIASYPRVANQNNPPRMGHETNPKMDPHAKLLPLARAVAKAEESPLLRKVLGIGSLTDDGVHVEPSEGTAIYIDGTARLNHLRAKYRANRENRGAA
jgi:hypothetical protein